MRRASMLGSTELLSWLLGRALTKGWPVAFAVALVAPTAGWAQQVIDRCEVMGKAQEKDACQLDKVQPSNLGAYVSVLFTSKSFDADTVVFFFPGLLPGQAGEKQPWSIFLASKNGTPIDKLQEMGGAWVIEDANSQKTLVLKQDGSPVFKFEYPLVFGLPTP
jgi:hypothetical protein